MASERKMQSVFNKNIKNCEKCGGEKCEVCAGKNNRFRLYSAAGIPVRYWGLAFSDFAGDKRFGEKIKGIISDIDGFFEKGESLAFVGNLGTGKTYAGCCILKKAIVSKYDCHYTQMTEVISKTLSRKTDSNDYLSYLTSVDFLMLDEFDPRHIFNSEKAEKLFGSTLEYVLRARFQNEIPTILCSNAEDIDEVLSSDFGIAFSSLRNMYMNVVCVSGKDFRKNVKN